MPHAIIILEKLMGASLKHLSFNSLSILKATNLFHIYMTSVRGLKGVFVSVLSRWIALGLVRPPKSRPGHKSAKEEDEKIDTESIKLDQVYCAWLIKWWIISGTWWHWVSIWRYWLVLGQYKLVLLDIRWYMVSKGLVCLYILEKVEIWSGDTDAWHTDWQTSEYRATQLVSSIKHKLSHAIHPCLA